MKTNLVFLQTLEETQLTVEQRAFFRSTGGAVYTLQGGSNPSIPRQDPDVFSLGGSEYEGEAAPRAPAPLIGQVTAMMSSAPPAPPLRTYAGPYRPPETVVLRSSLRLDFARVEIVEPSPLGAKGSPLALSEAERGEIHGSLKRQLHPSSALMARLRCRILP